MKKEKIIVVVGPTATGKTKLGIELAKKFGGEIISADSMQIYNGLDILTAKPSVEEMDGIPHHIMGFLDIGETFSVAEFTEMAKKIISDIVSRGKTPILVGGTGLYVDSLISNMEFSKKTEYPEIRQKLYEIESKHGREYLHSLLEKVDKISAENIHFNNVGRVIRALEVFEATGVPMSEHKEKAIQTEKIYEPLYFGLRFENREKLYDRMNLRVDLMVENGLENEAKEAYLKQDISLTAKQAIGYKEMYLYFEGQESFENVIDQIKKNTRHYGKRQLTWFRKNADIQWFLIDEYKSFDEIVEKSINIAEKFLI